MNQMPQSKVCMMGFHQTSQMDPIGHNHRADNNTHCQDIFTSSDKMIKPDWSRQNFFSLTDNCLVLAHFFLKKILFFVCLFEG